ncbi:hypothetical protein NECAME_02806 [Necator americanus]|uniref:Uncharacterized protein n=1 Tax=Necator americanus TaxID=51031 RepID=W2TAP0_NECAM|nr:hypothetical protein NECAME_02806 [Necator americanus]ETN78659.1 hypothetical protein NECAME_02806 [Necator americanus]
MNIRNVFRGRNELLTFLSFRCMGDLRATCALAPPHTPEMSAAMTVTMWPVISAPPGKPDGENMRKRPRKLRSEFKNSPSFPTTFIQDQGLRSCYAYFAPDCNRCGLCLTLPLKKFHFDDDRGNRNGVVSRASRERCADKF